MLAAYPTYLNKWFSVRLVSKGRYQKVDWRPLSKMQIKGAGGKIPG